MSTVRPTAWQVARAEWLRLTAYFVLVVLGSVTLWVAVNATRALSLFDPSVLVGLVFGVLMGALLGLGLARDWAVAGGRHGRLAYNRALRIRRLPADADDETWLRLLDQTEQEGSRVTFSTIALSILVGLNLVTAVTSSWPRSLPQWLLAAAFSASLISGLVQTRPRRAAARDLLDQLRARRRAGVLPETAPTSGTSPRD